MGMRSDSAFQYQQVRLRSRRYAIAQAIVARVSIPAGPIEVSACTVLLIAEKLSFNTSRSD